MYFCICFLVIRSWFLTKRSQHITNGYFLPFVAFIFPLLNSHYPTIFTLYAQICFLVSFSIQIYDTIGSYISAHPGSCISINALKVLSDDPFSSSLTRYVTRAALRTVIIGETQMTDTGQSLLVPLGPLWLYSAAKDREDACARVEYYIAYARIFANREAGRVCRFEVWRMEYETWQKQHSIWSNGYWFIRGWEPKEPIYEEYFDEPIIKPK